MKTYTLWKTYGTCYETLIIFESKYSRRQNTCFGKWGSFSSTCWERSEPQLWPNDSLSQTLTRWERSESKPWPNDPLIQNTDPLNKRGVNLSYGWVIHWFIFSLTALILKKIIIILYWNATFVIISQWRADVQTFRGLWVKKKKTYQLWQWVRRGLDWLKAPTALEYKWWCSEGRRAEGHFHNWKIKTWHI